MKKSNHIIEKVRLEVNTSRLETAHSIRNNIDTFLKNDLFPRLELLFDEYNYEDKILRIDELTLDLLMQHGSDFSNLPTEIYNQIKEKIDRQIPYINDQNYDPEDNSAFEKQNIRSISKTLNSGNVLLFFLENGYLPWYGKEDQIASLTQTESWEEKLENQSFFGKLDQMLGVSETASDRFILQFPDELIAAYLSRKDLRIHAETSAILKISQTLDLPERHIFLKLLIRLAHDDFPRVSEIFDRLIFGVMMEEKRISRKTDIPEIEQFKRLFERIIPKTSLQDSVLEKIDLLFEGQFSISNPTGKSKEQSPDKRKNLEERKLEDNTIPVNLETQHSSKFQAQQFLDKNEGEIRVQNAGLILLHPFLKQFFTTTGIIGKQEILVHENFDLAVHSLHFLATGNENAFEGNLVFEKFLCGVPLKTPVQKQSLLTEQIKNEANELLTEVIRHWPVLKNTSADGLRQLFIQRDGKLFQEDTKYRLIVERKTQDVLLEKLSWNISVIKMPWISNLLFTEW